MLTIQASEDWVKGHVGVTCLVYKRLDEQCRERVTGASLLVVCAQVFGYESKGLWTTTTSVVFDARGHEERREGGRV